MIDSVLPVYRRTDFAILRGEGAYVHTDDGRKLLDFTAGIAVNALGHCHPTLIKALTEQAGILWHTSNLYQVPGQKELADKLTAKTFADSVFFCNSGSEAIELAIKMVRRYFSARGLDEKTRIITIEGAFHGRTMAAISAAGKSKLIEGFAPLLEGFDHVPYGNHEALEAAIGPQTAAILLEPIQGEGGIRVIPEQCLRGLRELCDRHGLLLIFDEIQCGMGRTGKGFAYEWADARPDIMAVAKGIGGGFPLGACLATEEVAKAMHPGSHGSTYGGNPLAMAVGNAVVDIVLDEAFLAEVGKIGAYLRDGLEKLALKYPDVIQEIRGKGLLLGMKMKGDSAAFLNALRGAGLLTAPAADSVIRLLPPLNITLKEADEALGILEKICQKSAQAPGDQHA